MSVNMDLLNNKHVHIDLITCMVIIHVISSNNSDTDEIGLI